MIGISQSSTHNYAFIPSLHSIYIILIHDNTLEVFGSNNSVTCLSVYFTNSVICNRSCHLESLTIPSMCDLHPQPLIL